MENKKCLMFTLRGSAIASELPIEQVLVEVFKDVRGVLVYPTTTPLNAIVSVLLVKKNA